MATAGYNRRPRSNGKYVDGKRRSGFVRFLMRVFPWKGDGSFEVVRKLIFIGALGCLVYFGGGILIEAGTLYYQQYKVDNQMRRIFGGGLDIDDDIRDSVLKEKPQILQRYIEAYHDNNDLVGHIMIPDMNSDLPGDDLGRFIVNYLVYQTDNNHYYLDRAFDHTYSRDGAIFADFRNRFGEDGQISANTVLYGHNSYSQNFFTPVARYYRLMKQAGNTDYYRQYPLVQFNTLYEESEWKIFAVAMFNTEHQYGEVYRYTMPEFRDREHFNEFILDIMDRSILFTDVDLTYGDYILTLSTCLWPYRTRFGAQIEATRAVVFARKVRDGESSYVDVSKATYNRNFLPFELQRQNGEDNWIGRVWNTDYLLSYDGE
jgi:sortase B